MRVALVTNGIASTFHATLELGRRLVADGADVTVVSHVDLAAGCAAHGLEFVHLDDERRAVAEIRRRWSDVATGRPPRPAAIAGLLRAVRAGRSRTVASSELRAWLDDVDPDVVVADVEAHVAIVTALATGVPLLLTTFLFGIHERPGLPPISSSSLPGAPDLAAQWRRLHDERRRSELRRRVGRRGLYDLLAPVPPGTTSAVAIRAVARRLGVDLGAHVDRRSWLRPHAYTRLPVLSCNLGELELPHDVPDNWHYVGPMVRRDRVDVGQGAADRAAWTAVRAAWESDRTGPRVYASLGSYWAADVDLLGRLIDAFRDHPDRRLLIGLGGRLEPAALGPLPPNVVALRWAPQVEALELADLAIVHGGNAAMNECVVAGVPMVVVSTGHLDQDGVAARVEFHGIGRRLGRDAGAEQIADTVGRLLRDDDARSAIEALRAIAEDPGRRRAAVDAIVGAAVTTGGE